MKRICPKCRKEYTELENYCTKCGLELEKPPNRCCANKAVGCAMLQRARWAVSKETSCTKWNNETGGFIECSGYEDFKKKYLKAAKQLKSAEERGIINITDEMFRKKIYCDRTNVKPVKDDVFNGLVANAKRKGTHIFKCKYGDEFFIHLEKNNATA